MATLDTLDIEISASANKATTAIDALVTRLQTLSQSLGGLSNTQSLVTLASGLSQLSQSAEGLKNIRTNTFQKVADSITVIGNANTGSLETTAQGIGEIAYSLWTMNNVNVDNLKSVASAIQSFGSEKGGNSIANMPQMADGIATFAEKLNALPDSSGAVANLRNVVNEISRLGGTNVTQSIPNLTDVSVRLTAFIEKLNSTPLTFDVTKVTSLISSVAQLGRAVSGRGIDRIPQFAENLRQLFTTLSKAPAVSNNIISMTKALAQLTANLGNVRGTSTQASAGLNDFTRTAKRSHTSIKSLASSIGMFYAKFWIAIRGIQTLGKYVRKAMGLKEIDNYFSNALEDIAKNNHPEYKNMGEKAGEIYIQGFVDKFKSNSNLITEQMTGFKYDDNSGMMMSTGTANLGMNPADVIRFQTQYAQMANSMGMAEKSALRLSEVYTKLGADLASVKDVDYADAWADMSSGMVGMSKVMDKYGINIRVSALNEELANMGIDTTVNKLNAQQKAMLRSIVMLKSSKFAWADLSETIDQPANQLRIMQIGFQNLGTTIGGILLSGFAKLLPYINAVISALQQLAQWIINVFGIKIPQVTNQSGGGFEGLTDGIEDAEDAMDGASKSAKKLKNNLLGIDELNIISPDTGAGGAGGGYNGLGLEDAFWQLSDDYLKEWQKAYENITKPFDNVIKNLMTKVELGDWRGLGKAIADLIRNALENIDWNSIFKGARRFGEVLADFLNGLLDPKLGYELGKGLVNIVNTAFEFLDGFVSKFNWKNAGNFLANLVNGFVDNANVSLWAHAISTGLKGAIEMALTFLDKTNFSFIGEKIGQFFKELDYPEIFRGVGKVIIEALWACVEMYAGWYKNDKLSATLVGILAGCFTVAKLKSVVEAIEVAFFGNKWVIQKTIERALVSASGGAVAKSAGVFGKLFEGTFLQKGAIAIKSTFSKIGGTMVTTLSTAFTTDIATVVGAGTFAEIGTMIAGGIVGGLIAAIAGYQIGTMIYETIIEGTEWDAFGYDFFHNKEIESQAEEVTYTINLAREDWNDALGRVSQDLNWSALENFKGSKEWATIVNDMSGALTELGKAGVDITNTAEVTDYLNQNLMNLNGVTYSYIENLSKEYEQLDATTRAYLEQQYGIEMVTTGLADNTVEIARNMVATDQAIKSAGGYSTTLNGTASATQGFTGDLKILPSEMQKCIEKYEDATGKLTAYTKELQYNATAEERHERAVNATKQAVQQYADEQRKALGIVDESKNQYNEFVEALDNTNISANEFSQYLETLSSTDLPLVTQKLVEFGTQITNLQTSLPLFKTAIQEAFMQLNTDVLLFSQTNMPLLVQSVTTLLNQLQTGLTMFQNKTRFTINQIQKFFEDILEFVDENINVRFTEEYLTELFANVEPVFTETWKHACNGAITIFNEFIDEINDAMDISWSDLVVNGQTIVKAGHAQLLHIASIPLFESGGFPDRGSLFMANEGSGAELIGNINGRTAVVNNDQIINAVAGGVREAVADAMVPYLSQIANNTRETADKDMSVRIGDRDIARANVRGQRAMGRTIISTT